MGTPCLCWVSPIAQHTMTFSLLRTRSNTSWISSRDSPVAARTSAQSVFRA
ncbi:hypothetical protein GA0115255_119962 [Streptomyces sp. Ncost-T6T-2b]|nr:hypothetical protein GA0115255_119962 [Streptomyces sp. Ncost-T6T-2b]